MKKISLLVIVAALFFACGGNKKSKLILGDWKIADMVVPMPPNMPDSLKTQYEAMLKSQVEKIKTSSTFSYKDDGTYAYNFAGQAGGGTWKLNEEATELSLTEAGKTNASKIVELTENKLVFEAPQPNGAGNVTLTLAK
ncbi:MAG TPA: lipocalin family protein [Bacteroidia bacterium]|nr:lipocalin family protein [Bacteroidia bacterium]